MTNSLKKPKEQEAHGYFTLSMLSRDFVVGKGIERLALIFLIQLWIFLIQPWIPKRDTQRRADAVKETFLRSLMKKEMRERGLRPIQSIKNTISHPSTDSSCVHWSLFCLLFLSPCIVITV
ncbi:MAG: hypothetical protein QXU18_10610 [Thermoplasmatales archaeon]